MSETTGLPVWKNNRLLANCTPEEIKKIEALTQEKTFETGQILVEEGAKAEHLYLLSKGEIEVFRKEGDASFRIATLHEGDFFGEMALLDETVRSASIRALTPVSLQEIRVEEFRTFLAEEPSLVPRLLGSYSKEQNRRLRLTSDAVTDSLRRELQRMREHVRLSLMLISVVIAVWIYSAAILELKDVPELRRLTSLVISLLTFGGSVYFIKTSSYSLQHYGLSTQGLLPAIRFHLRWTLVFIAFLTALKWLLVSVIPALSHRPVFEIRFLTYKSPLLALVIMIAVYILVSSLQEFGSRCVLQSSFGLLIQGPRSNFWAIFLSNALYSMFHMHYSLGVAFATFLLGLFFGVLWSRHPSFLAVSLAHFISGFWCIEFLGALSLLGMKV